MTDVTTINGLPARWLPTEGYALGIDGTVWSYWKPGKRDGSGQKFNTWSLRLDLSPRRLRPTPNDHGYLVCQLGKYGPQDYVHRMMWRTWRGVIPPDAQVRHLDGDRGNNKIENLAAGTVEENAADKRMHGTHPTGETHTNAKLLNDQVIEARRLYRSGMMLKDVLAHLQLPVSIGILSRAVTGGSWTHLDHIEAPVVPGRQVARKGEQSSNAKLTDDLVIEARRLRRETQMTQQEIIDLLQLDMTVYGLNGVLVGRSWKHLNHIAPPCRRVAKRRPGR